VKTWQCCVTRRTSCSAASSIPELELEPAIGP
jgi:hypothetical protein